MNREIVSNALFAATMIAMGTLWYFAWVVPNTERMYSIMDCMHEIGDQSQDGYNICAKRLNEGG